MNGTVNWELSEADQLIVSTTISNERSKTMRKSCFTKCFIGIISVFLFFVANPVCELYAQQTGRGEWAESKDDFLKAFAPAKSGVVTKGGAIGKGPQGTRAVGGMSTEIPDSYMALQNLQYVKSRILFDSGKWYVLKNSFPTLCNIADILKNHYPDLKLIVVGHTDSEGPDDLNMRLSKMRAIEVKDFLKLAYGIPEGRLSVKWFGEKHQCRENSTAEGRKENRRVEFFGMR